MEIGSMNSMMGMMGMQGMQGMGGMQSGPPPEKPDAEEMSSKFMDAMDSDGDSLLSKSEFSADGSSESSEAFDVLDTNEDGFVSQDELQAEMQAKMDSMKGQMPAGGAFGGLQQQGDMGQFQQLMNMAGNSSEDQSFGADRYGKMQQAMFGGYDEQTSTSGLNITA